MASLRLAAILAVALLAAPVLGSHPQPLPNGGSITFKEKTGGNEWWVEVIITSTSPVSKVEVMDDGGPWAAMTHHPEWGSWALSYHVEPGHRVTFRATTAAGVVTSCPFAHPAAVEQCSTTGSGWVAREMASFAPNTDAHEVAVGDGDGDGRSEAYVPTLDGLYQVSWTSTGWKKVRIADGPYGAVATGFIGTNSLPHVFAASGTSVRMLTFEGDVSADAPYGWFESHLFSAPDGIEDMVLGDVDDDGDNEVWTGSPLDGGRIAGYDWDEGPVFLGTNVYGVHELAVGDGDNDGDDELFLLQGNRGQNGLMRADWDVSGGGSNGVIVPSNGNGGFGLAVADIDRDGRREVYMARGSSIDIARSVAPGTVWTVSSVSIGAQAAGPREMAVADPNNDGQPELYVMRGDAHLMQVSWNGAWAVRDLGALAGLTMPLVAGDADNDRLVELHGMTFSVGTSTGPRLLQFSDHPVAPRPPSPPAPWAVSFVDGPARSHGQTDLTVGDGDRDGRRELYVPLRAGLFQEEWTGTGWATQQISTEAFQKAVVGDVDRDGKGEVYAAGTDSISRFFWDGGAWQRHVLASPNVPLEGFGCATLGDVDDDGQTELYALVDEQLYGFEGNNTPSPVWRVTFANGAWSAQVVTGIPGGAWACWVGDGDNDGDLDLWVAGQEGIWRVDKAGAAWEVTLVDNPEERVDFSFLTGIVVADADRNVKQELYVTQNGDEPGIYRYEYVTVVPVPGGGGSQSAWIRTRIVASPGITGFNDLFAADVDKDSFPELYATTDTGHLFQVVRSNQQWNAWDLGDVPDDQDAGDLVLGDADNDGSLEAYVSAFRFDNCCPTHNIYQFRPGGSTPPGFDATFTKVTGNEWWIQANVAATGGTLAKVDVRINSGAWQPLAKQSWGGWAASYRAMQGSVVQLRATSTVGATDLSDCYQWIPPNGQDAAKVPCQVTPPPPPPPPPGTFDATFTGVRGNEWWVQANVATNGLAVTKVDVTIDGGATWRPLAKQSWGPTAWAASYRIVQGTIVQLRATASDGQTDLSSCRQWIPPQNTDATIVPCQGTPPPPPPPPPPGGFQATFSQASGNEWWAEVVVTANEPVHFVFVHFNCTGEPADMTFRSDWGKWVLGNTRIPAGTKVVFEAGGDSGMARSGGYIWPNATPTSGCP